MLQVRGEGKPLTSFAHVSSLLNSAPLVQAVELRELWAMLYEPTFHEPLDPSIRAVKVIQPRRHNHDMVIVSVSGLEPGFDESQYPKLATEYPALARLTFSRSSGAGLDANGRPTCSVELLDPTSNDPDRFGVDYRGSRVAMPAVGLTADTMHPLMAWWATLYALSMVARYHPAAWTAITDVDSSPHAVAIEYLLSVAQDSLPDVLWRTLTCGR